MSGRSGDLTAFQSASVEAASAASASASGKAGCPLDYRGHAGIGHAVGSQQLPRLVGGHRAKVKAGRDRLPAAGEPAGVRGMPASGDHEGVVGEHQQQLAPQPGIQGRHLLVGVEEYHRVGLVRGAAQGRLEDRRIGPKFPPVEPDDSAAAVARTAGDLAQKRALADTARAADVDH